MFGAVSIETGRVHCTVRDALVLERRRMAPGGLGTVIQEEIQKLWMDKHLYEYSTNTKPDQIGD